MTELIAEQARTPTVRDFLPLPSGDSQYPLTFVEVNKLIKLRENDTTVVVGYCNGFPPELQTKLESFHGKSIAPVKIESAVLQAHVARMKLAARSPQSNHPSMSPAPSEPSSEVPAANILAGIISDAVRLSASDIHLEREQSGAVLRFRIDGVLEVVDHLETKLYSYIANRVKLLARLNTVEKRRPQDGRVSFEVSGSQVDCRIATLNSQAGESIVIRLFPTSGNRRTLEELSFRPEHRREIREILRKPSGLFLVTGPTGSGKTTTLNSLLNLLSSPKKKVVSIEDPIEQIVDGVVQVQTHEAIGLGFDTVLRSVLRHDPDVIMVGEIRDSATADQVVRASLTGHLVLSTLHTRSAIGAVARLRDLGVPAFLLAEVLQAVCAQRLVRRLCRRCMRPVEPTSGQRRIFAGYGYSVGALFEPGGCPHCRHTGFSGRLPLFEILKLDDPLRDAIACSQAMHSGRSPASSIPGGSLLEDGLLRVRAGETSLDEVEAVVDFS